MLNPGVPQSNYDQQRPACTSLYFFAVVPPFAIPSRKLSPSHSDSRKRGTIAEKQSFTTCFSKFVKLLHCAGTLLPGCFIPPTSFVQRGERAAYFRRGDTAAFKTRTDTPNANSFSFLLRDEITTVAFRDGIGNRVAGAIRANPRVHGSSRRVALLNSRL